MKLKDNQWVSIGNVALSLLSQPLSGKLNRLLRIVVDKTATLRNQFEEEVKEATVEGSDPLEVNLAVTESFSKGETDLDLPEFKAEWFDDVYFHPGYYEFLKPIMT